MKKIIPNLSNKKLYKILGWLSESELKAIRRKKEKVKIMYKKYMLLQAKKQKSTK